MCGGTNQTLPSNRRGRGLSPRVRGNHLGWRRRLVDAGSIPACAGEPDNGSRWWRPGTVYPRVCGGTDWAMWPVSRSGGLSPRVRGNRLHAGERSDRVYPRVCGGTPPVGDESPITAGLSPRVRGNRLIQYDEDGEAISIPACAGEPGTLAVASPHSQVYPRVCGGTRRRVRVSYLILGLSPRVRGNPSLPSENVSHHWGSIPACAGEPC